MYAQIVLLKKTGDFEEGLTYQVPKGAESVYQIGDLVEAPFRNRAMTGIIIGFTETLPPELTPLKIRPLSRPLEIHLPEAVPLAFFIATHYSTTPGRALRLMIPRALREGRFTPPETVDYLLGDDPLSLNGPQQKKIVEIFQENGGRMSLDDLKKRMPDFRPPSLKSLLKKGILKEERNPLYQTVSFDQFPLILPDKILSEDQKTAIKEVLSGENPSLLYGITGSGKTEIYLRLILETIKKGKQAILLVPEIALTPQMTDYFRTYFQDHLSVFHSRLSETERMREWWKVYTGFSPLLIGSRSAIFAPAKKLGLIIMDEEHEWTYKQESSPYYETHRIAEEISKTKSVKLVLGSATPRLESYEKARRGDYNLIFLKERIHQGALPLIRIVDLRDEFKKRNFSIFSLLLRQKMAEKLERKEQIILFINQRGLSRAIVCRDCGYTEECPHCDIALKYHRSGHPEGAIGQSRLQDILICHYCGFRKSPPLVCPKCQSHYIRHVGVGTQRVEEEVHLLFPRARTLRADRDTTQKKEGFAPFYQAFKEGRADILIGTQMVAKGLDFFGVSLIGIILADIGLHIPDFRSHERLFQLLTQVSGRCGRANSPGEVILQTYQPDHFAIQKAARYEYEIFAEKELEYRKKAGYPPFGRLIKCTVIGKDREKLEKHVEVESQTLEDIGTLHNLPLKITWAPALLSKMAGHYYYQVLIRGENPEKMFDHWRPPNRGWRVDVDPIHT